jgi:RAD51-like protein 2
MPPPSRGVDIDVVLRSFPPSLRSALKSRGFRSDSDFVGVQPLELASEACISHDEALRVLLELSGGESEVLRAPNVTSAKEILDKEKRKKAIVTFCQDLDRVLGGGIRSGQITEFCGAPGVGKTQIMMQIAINVQMPAAFNGLCGEAVYVDTEGSFAPKRCLHMASAFCKHLEKVAVRRNNESLSHYARMLEPEAILERIHYFRARDVTEQLAVVDVLPSFISEHPNVKVVIIDSIAFHFRQDFEDMGVRTRRLIQMGQSLMDLAHSRDLAVVLTNHVTTKIMGEGKSRIVPALGESWAHAATNRVLCYWQNAKRHAFVFKSPSLPAAGAEFQVSSDGIRGTRRSQGTKRRNEMN